MVNWKSTVIINRLRHHQAFCSVYHKDLICGKGSFIWMKHSIMTIGIKRILILTLCVFPWKPWELANSKDQGTIYSKLAIMRTLKILQYSSTWMKSPRGDLSIGLFQILSWLIYRALWITLKLFRWTILNYIIQAVLRSSVIFLNLFWQTHNSFIHYSLAMHL